MVAEAYFLVVWVFLTPGTKELDVKKVGTFESKGECLMKSQEILKQYAFAKYIFDARCLPANDDTNRYFIGDA
jgi:hypothetical protein